MTEQKETVHAAAEEDGDEGTREEAEKVMRALKAEPGFVEQGAEDVQRAAIPGVVLALVTVVATRVVARVTKKGMQQLAQVVESVLRSLRDTRSMVVIECPNGGKVSIPSREARQGTKHFLPLVEATCNATK